jgi:hypothetical protein
VQFTPPIVIGSLHSEAISEAAAIMKPKMISHLF